MAILTAKTGNSFGMFDLQGETPPAGTFAATVVDVKDQFGVTRPKYDNPQETETVDLTGFLFGFRDQEGRPHKIQSRRMRISGNEKSALFGFLKSLLGRPPKIGWDYCELKGVRVLITVDHAPKRDGSGSYPEIVAVSPLPQGFSTPAPQPTPAPAFAPATKMWTPPAKAQEPVPSDDSDPIPF